MMKNDEFVFEAVQADVGKCRYSRARAGRRSGKLRIHETFSMTSSPHLVSSFADGTKYCGLFTKNSAHNCGQGGIMAEPIGAPARDSAPVGNFAENRAAAAAARSDSAVSIGMLPPDMRAVAQ